MQLAKRGGFSSAEATADHPKEDEHRLAGYGAREGQGWPGAIPTGEAVVWLGGCSIIMFYWPLCSIVFVWFWWILAKEGLKGWKMLEVKEVWRC